MARAVLVQDMLRGFLEEGYLLYCGEEARKIIPNVQRLLKNMQDEGSAIIYLADAHDPDDKEFLMFPSHCVKGTLEAEIIPELSGYPGIIIPKKTYSSFYGTNLDEVLDKIKPEEVIVVGVCTNICILYAVADLCIRGYGVIIYADCVASFDAEEHVRALKHIKNVLGAKVIDEYKSS